MTELSSWYLGFYLSFIQFSIFMLGQIHTELPNPARPELQGSFHFRSLFADRLPNRQDVISQFVVSGLLVKQQRGNKDRKYPRRIKDIMAKAFLEKWSLKKVWFIYSSCHNQAVLQLTTLRLGMAAVHRVTIILPLWWKEEQDTPCSHPIPFSICCVVQFVYFANKWKMYIFHLITTDIDQKPQF